MDGMAPDPIDPMLIHYLAELRKLEHRQNELTREIQPMITAISLPRILEKYLQQKYQGLDGKAAMMNLWRYLDQNAHPMYPTSIYKYFNSDPASNRVPDRQFIELFADFVRLSPDTRMALIKIRDMAEKEKKTKRRTRTPKSETQVNRRTGGS